MFLRFSSLQREARVRPSKPIHPLDSSRPPRVAPLSSPRGEAEAFPNLVGSVRQFASNRRSRSSKNCPTDPTGLGESSAGRRPMTEEQRESSPTQSRLESLGVDGDTNGSPPPPRAVEKAVPRSAVRAADARSTFVRALAPGLHALPRSESTARGRGTASDGGTRPSLRPAALTLETRAVPPRGTSFPASSTRGAHLTSRGTRRSKRSARAGAAGTRPSRHGLASSARTSGADSSCPFSLARTTKRENRRRANGLGAARLSPLLPEVRPRRAPVPASRRRAAHPGSPRSGRSRNPEPGCAGRTSRCRG